MTDYANDDVDRIRVIATYCSGTEHEVFLGGLADRMEEVVSDVVRPVFTREDVAVLRLAAAPQHGEGCSATDLWPGPCDCGIQKGLLNSIADRIEQALPIEAPTVDVE